MSGPSRRALALVLVMAMPAAGLAQHANGGSGRSGSGGGSRTPASVRGSAPLGQPASQARTVPSNQGGFDFNRDITARPAVVPQRPATPQRLNLGNTNQQTAANFRRAPNAAGGGPFQGKFNGRAIGNPQHWNGTWGWNRGVVWQPVQTYWGGGFWGSLALAELAGALLFGSIVDDQDQLIYPSYQVEPDSPGAQLLQNYGLQQTPCGPPNLVVIWGPDNSVICALPNDTVGQGNYELDPSTLTIVSQSP
ncbi:MAG: hypothetical protein WAJ85_10635 [Candidatus Baltobacteraceae bacterium]